MGLINGQLGVGKNGEVIVDFCRHPHYGHISLHDTSIDDLRNLGEMFLAVARKLQQTDEDG